MPKGRKKNQGFTKAGNNLLNFHFEQRDIHEYGSSSRPFRSNGTGNYKRGTGSGVSRAPLNRDAYVAGRFKFCLKRDTSICGLIGQDKVSWNQVDRVLVETDGDTGVSCPICLSAVCAPRMTNCGHIFCWLCMKRLFFYTKEVFEHCPLCFSFIRIQDLRRVKVHRSRRNPGVGDKADFQLVHRFASCIVSTPVDESKVEKPLPCFKTLPVAPSCLSGTNLYSRLYVENPVGLLTNLKEEQDELVGALEDAKTYRDELGLVLLEEMRSDLADNQAKIEVLLAELEGDNMKVDEQDIDAASEGVVYLYQYAGNGKNVFLHPFSVRCLLTQYGDMSEFPTVLKGVKVVDVEQVVASEEVKKRYPFLAHIPLTAAITFVEVDLHNYLNQQTKELMADQIKKRQEKRRKRRKARRRAEKVSESSLKQEWLDQVALFDSNLVRQNIDSGYEFPDLPTGPVEVKPSIGSFATVVNSNGYFPALGESSLMSKSASPPKSSWVHSIDSSSGSAPRPTYPTEAAPEPSVSETQTTLSSSGFKIAKTLGDSEEKKTPITSSGRSTGRKKGKGKKVSLYSNSHHRVYH